MLLPLRCPRSVTAVRPLARSFLAVQVSTNHARLTVGGPGAGVFKVELEDLGSTNGSFVDDVRLNRGQVRASRSVKRCPSAAAPPVALPHVCGSRRRGTRHWRAGIDLTCVFCFDSLFTVCAQVLELQPGQVVTMGLTKWSYTLSTPRAAQAKR